MTTETDFYEDDGEEAPGLPAALRDPARVLRRQSRLILFSLALFLAVTSAATLHFPLKFQARATILLTAKSIPDEFVPTTIIANILEEFEAIRGIVFLRANLAKIISDTGLYPEERETLTLEDLAGRLLSELTVTPVAGVAGVGRPKAAPHSVSFEVAMSGEDPEVLAAVVNRTVAELISANVEYRSRQARVTTEFMEREYSRADEALRVHQRKLAEFRAQNRGALPEEQNGVTSKLERLEVQRGNAILLISEFQAQLERIDARPQAFTESETLEDLRSRHQTATAIYTDDHPMIISLKRQLTAWEEKEGTTGSTADIEALEEREAIAKGVEIEQLRLDQIDRTVSDLEGRLNAAPLIAEEYAALVREEAILEENYNEYLRKLKNAELALSLEHSQQGARLVRLDEAMPPTSPVIPRWLVACAGAVVSIGLALLIGVVRELLAPVLIDEQHLEDSIPIPCLGSISEIT